MRDYGLMLALLVAMIVGIGGYIGHQAKEAFGKIADKMETRHKAASNGEYIPVLFTTHRNSDDHTRR